MGSGKKEKIFSFKVGLELADMLQAVPNRSEFIRSALTAALTNLCPLCQGRGHLTEEQRGHWDAFRVHHELTRCEKCQAVHLVCDSQPSCPRH